MRKSPIFTAAGSTFLLVGGLVLTAPGATADTPDADAPNGAQPLLEAVESDLSDTATAEALDQQVEAAEVEEELRAEVGSEFGGAVFDTDDAELTVNVTDAAAAADLPDDVNAEVVTYGEDALADFVAELDATAEADDGDLPLDSITRWAPNVERDVVVIETLRGQSDAASEFAEAAGIDPDVVEIEVTHERPTMLQDVVGGQAYYPGSSRCSIGHAVEGGFATAGHCGSVGTSTTSPTGTVAGSVFPGSDAGWVQTNATTTPLVDLYQYGGYATVVGSQEAPIGAQVCRSGSTTGTYCGTIQGKNETVNYPQGTVNGLTRTTVCAEPGDSGGSWITPSRDAAQAQGVTSGGSGNCSWGGTTYFQPLNPILNHWNLTLVTG
ncbi:S1 family peptidase [Lipingzhangella sp. LS1_29]|uniref:S1 family peptidase n=1 Tax=Lipingzhangella rawalii TaxID=2055835 RepID=A0ABU2HB76_9ACTN|nr:S1 family peptidase [Lipingzhangella rawalii]MDS1272085.1 S1 family peptidase [Lipingzhangella rawalii]